MERQTKHRILGILVIIGLVVILLPLFQGGKEVSTKATLVKAPPFPGQALPLATPVETASSTSSSAMRSPQAVVAPEDLKSTTASLDAQSNGGQTHSLEKREMFKSAIASNTLMTTHSSEDMTMKKTAPVQTAQYKIIEGEKAASLLKKVHKSKHANKTKSIDIKNLKKSHTVASIRSTKTISVAKNKSGKVKATVHIATEKKATHVASLKRPVHAPVAKNNLHEKLTPLPVTASIDDDGLIKLKSAVWVIQIGSFKSKTNALKIVNQLRSNGYRAFIQQFSTAFDDHTSVFVGPENNPAAARILAERLKNEMHIQGIVISYKPLTL